MNSKAWRMSASVIIALRSFNVRNPLTKTELVCETSNGALNKPHRSSVHIISLRRGETDKHLPGTHVFPGGHLEKADTSLAWIDLYKSFGYGDSSFTSLSTGGEVECLPEYNGMSNTCVPGWMSLRLCAIRETFEESGILLCRSSGSTGQGLPYASFTEPNELTAWQSRVRADPCEMLALCHALECVPDVWGLHLWSNWLTPTQIKCCSCFDLLNLSSAGKIRLANPQFYEAARLANFLEADELAKFAHNRSHSKCVQMMPVQEKTKNGLIFILPGDSAYPQYIDREKPHKLAKREESCEELCERIKENAGVLHRIEVLQSIPYQRIVTHNYVPPYEKYMIPAKGFVEKNMKSHL